MRVKKDGMAEDIGFALIGAGMVAATHVDAAKAAEGARLIGVAASTEQSAQAFADRFDLEAFASVDAIARDARVRAAIVAAPPNVRESVIRPLVAAGKAILLEKPVARTSAEAEAVIRLCEDAGAPLGIVLQHRFRESSRAAKALIPSLGPLAAVEIAIPWWRDQAYYDAPGRGSYARDGGGVLISQAIHTLDLALWLAGPVASVQAISATTCLHAMEAEDFVAGGLIFENGAPGSLVASTASFPGVEETVKLHFDAASLTLTGSRLEIAHHDGRVETVGGSGGTGGGADPMAFSHEWHQAVIEDFAAALSQNRPPAITGRDALHAHLLIDALTQSASEGRRIAL